MEIRHQGTIAGQLASQRVGAIIAIERQIGLRNYIEGGIPLDATLTYDLIVSIFQLKSPLHDGAVIIQDDRIAAAACFLPLTVNPKLSKELGSRHRAAIGLTEENDSVSIVVSEETGKISVVVDGQIERDLSTDALRLRLPFAHHEQVVASTLAGGNRVKTPWPFGHLWLKMLSVALATMLWLFVSGDELVDRGLRVPLEFQQFPEGLEMVGEPPALVDVRVRGASAALSRLNAGDIVAQLDLRAARVGRRLYQLSPEQVRVPFGVQVVQVTPPSVAIAFEISASKQVPVVPSVQGQPAAGYVVGAIKVEPKTVEIVGPQSAVARVTEALTEPVSVAGARATVNDGATVGLPEVTVRLKTPRRADIQVEVMPGPVERTMRLRPVRFRNLDRNLVAHADPTGVDVVLRGSQSGVDATELDEVSASVDLSGLGPGVYTLPVRVQDPQRAGVARILPATIQVTISSGKN